MSEGGLTHAAVETSPITESTALPKEALARILDSATQAFVVHRGGAPLFINARARSLLGMDASSAALTRPVLDWLHPDDRPRAAAYARARLRGGNAPEDYEIRLLREDGREIWVSCRANLIDWEDGPAILAGVFDITPHKQTQRAQLRSETLFTRVFQATPDMVALSYLDTGIFLDVNDNLARAIGLSRARILGQSIFDLGIWEDPHLPMRMRARILGKGSIRHMEGRLRRSDGELFPVAFSGELLEVDGVRILLVIGRDITEDKRREAELMASRDAAELANRTKSEFLAHMSHELRTPLNAVIGFAEIIRDELYGALPDPRYRDYAGDIHRSGSHLLDIINDILDLSKVEARRLEIHREPLAPEEVISQAVRLVRDRATEAGLDLEIAIQPDAAEVVADRRLLKQILLNLLSNAIKFTPSGGRIDLHASAIIGGGLRLSIADTGIGMNEADIERALTPFGQAERALSRRQEGTGLGLPLVAAFVEAHAGRLEIDSDPGIGTTVTVELPGGEGTAGAAEPAGAADRRDTMRS